MKLKFLLFFLLTTIMAQAQVVCDYPEGVNTSLVISETRLRGDNAYIEITNMGDEPVQLGEFKLGAMPPWSRANPITDLCDASQWFVDTHDYMFLPDRTLEPDSSFVITAAYDFRPWYYRKYKGRLGGSERVKQVQIYDVADKLIHREEPIDGVVYPGDSVTTAANDPETLYPRGDYSLVLNGAQATALYLEHHYAEGDSAVVDQVGGVFDSGGRNTPRQDYNVAGVEGGLATAVLVRKYTVKDGTIDFDAGRGVSIDDSEWLPIEIPEGYDDWRDLWWTVGNHDNYTLDENTLESDDLDIDYAGKTITVPWGTRRLDDIMRHMKKKPGIAWNYNLNANVEDSLYRSAQNGDQLTVYVVGNTLQTATFDIVVEEPTAADNIVIPIDHRRSGIEPGPVTNNTQNGILGWPRVTTNESVTDTITGSGYGLEYGTRVDTLFKYLEKPVNASWEIVWVDGVERPDLKDGDKLKVVAQNGSEKEYYIQLEPYQPSQNAYLSAITWPDIPEKYRGVMGWTGDTIPNFASGSYNYRLEVPYDVEGIPALVAKTEHPNATVKVHRATSLDGTTEDATVVFEVIAELDTVKQIYSVELVKEKFPGDVEPFFADPFISEFDNSVPNGNAYLEIYNPGNQPIDLRNYMFGMRNNGDPASPITSFSSTSEGNWEYRYTTYIPGLKYGDFETWQVYPKYLFPDVNVSPWLQGGETFVMAIVSRGPGNGYYEDDFVPFKDYDVQFVNEALPGYTNPWGEYVKTSSGGGTPIPPNGNRRNSIFAYKVLNDSVKLGLKPNTDPNDFKLIDYWGMGEQAYWVIGGVAIPTNQTNHAFIRKPEITTGNPILFPEAGGSFGTNLENCEWTWTRQNEDYGHIPYPERRQAALNNLGAHYMIPPTYYKSTVKSRVYKVSPGFADGEEIIGIVTGTTVADLFANLIKEDEGQVLNVKSVADGSDLAQDAMLSMNDTLVVMAADSINKTYYRLNVNEDGLSSDAVLTSTRFTVKIDSEPKSAAENQEAGTGTISGIELGTTLKFIANNVTVPAGATMTIIDSEGAYIPYKILNFDTTYVQVNVNPDMYFEVVAEDGITTIIYQLQPETGANDVFVLSDMYTVKQSENLISNIPKGSSVSAFYSNVVPSLGATMKVVDKMGFERTLDDIREDDKLIVSSANGEITRVYHFSLLSGANTNAKAYLAYVLSNRYSVDQVDYVIEGPTSQTSLNDFYSNITPVEGASVVVVDAEMNEKAEGDLEDGDMLKVTSMDGKIVVFYQLDLNTTGVDVSSLEQFKIYPNPSVGELNVSGLSPGYRVRLINAMGIVVRDFSASSSMVSFNINDQPKGMYIISISNKDNMLGIFKAIVQ